MEMSESDREREIEYEKQQIAIYRRMVGVHMDRLRELQSSKETAKKGGE